MFLLLLHHFIKWKYSKSLVQHFIHIWPKFSLTSLISLEIFGTPLEFEIKFWTVLSCTGCECVRTDLVVGNKRKTRKNTEWETGACLQSYTVHVLCTEYQTSYQVTLTLFFFLFLGLIVCVYVCACVSVINTPGDGVTFDLAGRGWGSACSAQT